MDLNAEHRIIYHIDMDAFFASIEVKDNPSLAGKPVIVCGDPTGRSVVTSPTYEARPFGIHAGMAVAEARRRCPNAIFIQGDHRKYIHHSLLMQKALLEFSPYMEPMSIDEVFMDMSDAVREEKVGAERVMEEHAAIARKMKAAIFRTVGVTATVGIGPNKLVAKLASKARKPDGLTVISAPAAPDFVASLPIGKLWGVGEAFETALKQLGIHSVRDVLAFPLALLAETFGAAGESLYLKARAMDDSPVVPYFATPDPKSIGHEITFDRNIGDASYLTAVFSTLADKVAVRLREKKLRARTITVKVRFPNFTTRTRRVTLYEPTDYDHEIFLAAVAAWNRIGGEGDEPGKRAASRMETCALDRRGPVTLSRAPLRKGVRLIGISAGNLHEESAGEQQTVFENVRIRQENITLALDRIRKKHGEQSISRARAMPCQRDRDSLKQAIKTPRSETRRPRS